MYIKRTLTTWNFLLNKDTEVSLLKSPKKSALAPAFTSNPASISKHPPNFVFVSILLLVAVGVAVDASDDFETVLLATFLVDVATAEDEDASLALLADEVVVIFASIEVDAVSEVEAAVIVDVWFTVAIC